MTFTAPSSGASAVLSAATATIGSNGVASVTATANSTIGSYTVAATVGAGLTGNFSLTNTTATPVVSVADAGGTYNGSAFPASASVTGSQRHPVLQPGGSHPDPRLLRREHGGRHAAGGCAAPRGHVHRRRHVPRQHRLRPAASAPATFAITKATPAVTVTDAGGTFTGSPFPATASVTGVSGPASPAWRE